MTAAPPRLPKRHGFTPAQQHAFQRDGFIAFGKVIGDEQLATLRHAFDDEFERARSGESPMRNLSIEDTDVLATKLNASEQVFQISPMCERNITFYRLLFHPHILDLVEDLIGPAIQLYRDQALYKPPHRGGEVYWHQDNAYWQCTPAALVTCWLALDDVTVTNGAMQCIPGTHHVRVRHDTNSGTTSLYDLSSLIDDRYAQVCDLPAGGIMFHHCQVVHRTGQNKTAKPRRAYAMHFMPVGTRSIATPGPLKPSFGRPILRLPLADL